MNRNAWVMLAGVWLVAMMPNGPWSLWTAVACTAWAVHVEVKRRRRVRAVETAYRLAYRTGAVDGMKVKSGVA